LVVDGLLDVELDFVIDCGESADGDDLVEGLFSPVLSDRASFAREWPSWVGLDVVLGSREMVGVGINGETGGYEDGYVGIKSVLRESSSVLRIGNRGRVLKNGCSSGPGSCFGGDVHIDCGFQPNWSPISVFSLFAAQLEVVPAFSLSFPGNGGC
jgi:hypothetical protein